jgi:hypothetical protein
MPPLISPHLLRYGRSQNVRPPLHLDTRYDQSGVFLPEPGNTVVCHLQPNTPTESAIIQARARILDMPDSNRLALTPVESLHMTLFQGIIEGRRAPPYWPSEMATDQPIETMTAWYEEKLRDFTGGPPFEVAVIDAVPTGLVVEGATVADRQAMALWRDRLADVFRYRHPDHDSYVYHITFAYPVEWLDDEMLPQWQNVLDEIVADIGRRAPVLALRQPAFCSFADMNWFEELVPLPAQAH